MPVNVDGADSIACDVRSDRAVFLIKMKRTIFIDNRQVDVSPGNWVVSQFKSAIGVEHIRKLEAIVNGKLVALNDDATINIRGNEEFVSYTPN